MEKNNIFNNSYFKYQSTYNKESKKWESKEETLSEKNNIIFVKDNHNYIQVKSSKDKKNSQKKYEKKNNDIYYNENKKKKMMNENMKLFIDNITNEDNLMTKSVNIHNINLINSMNNITFLESYQNRENKITNKKKEFKKLPINKFNSQRVKKKNSNSNISVKHNSSIDLNSNSNKNSSYKNIIVNKKKIFLDSKYKRFNNKSYSTSHSTVNKKNNDNRMRKNQFNIFNFKKINLSLNNFKSVTKYNNEHNSKNELYKKVDNVNINKIYQEEIVKMKKNRNNKINEKGNKDDKNDYFIYNTFSNYSMNEEDINGINNKIFSDKMNNRQNVINVNKLEAFKKNNNNSSNNNTQKHTYSSNIKKNNSSFRISSNSNSNSKIISLLSNLNKEKKANFNIENMNKLRKNINQEKLFNSTQKERWNYSKFLKINKIRNDSKPKSAEKNNNKNKENKKAKKIENKILNKKMRTLSSFLKDKKKIILDLNREDNISNTKIDNDNIFRRNSINMNIGEIYKNTYKVNNTNNTNDTNNTNYTNNIGCNTNNSSNRYMFSNINSGNNSKRFHKNKTKDINSNRPKRSIKNNKKNENNNESNIEKIEVNKKKFYKNIISNQLKKRFKQKYFDTRNNSLFLNLYVKNLDQEPWINSAEQIDSCVKNNEDFCLLNNNKGKKEEKIEKEEKEEKEEKNDYYGKKNIPSKSNVSSSNIIYNKKQLCFFIKKRINHKNKLDSMDYKNKKLNFDENEKKLDIKDSPEKMDYYNIDEFNENNNIENIDKNMNIDEFIFNNNNDKDKETNEEQVDRNRNEQLNLNSNNIFLKKCPSNRIYKKPGRNEISNSSLITAKDSFKNKNPLNPKSTNLNQNDESNNNCENKKIKLNIKLNNYIKTKKLSHINLINKEIDNSKNLFHYNEDILPKINIKENVLMNAIGSFNNINNNLSNKLYKGRANKSNDYIVNIDQLSLIEINKKVTSNNCFIKKYYSYYIGYNKNNINCFFSKIRINKSNLKVIELPSKKICYYSKTRKIFVKIIPHSQICYFKKELIEYHNYINNINDNNKFLNNNIKEDNKLKDNEFYYYKNKISEDSIHNKPKAQFSFASLNSYEQNLNESGSNYFEISFGKKVDKSIINLHKGNFSNYFNNNVLSNKFIFKGRNINESNKKPQIEDNGTGEFVKIFNNNSSEKETKFLCNNINISPYKNTNNNDDETYLKKTEEGLKLLEKIAGKRMSPFPKEKIITNPESNRSNNEIEYYNDKLIKGTNNFRKEYIKKNNIEQNLYNKVINKNKNSSKSSNTKIKTKKIKNDFIEMLNIITFDNYDIILNKISNIILNNNIVTIIDISQLLINQNEFIDIIINKAMKEKIYIKIYSKLCKDLFINLMNVIDNYNDDMDIFDKLTNDKSLKVNLKNKIFEKLKEFDFSNNESMFIQDNINNIENKSFYSELKYNYIGLINFVAELSEIKILSQKTVFEILDLLYKRYMKGNNNINILLYNDLYLEGIEVLLNKIKKIIYEKNNPEHINRYNKFIKNYLNNIFKDRIKKNNLKKYLYYKLLNLIENHKNEKEFKNQQKVKTFIKYKNKNYDLNILPENNKNNNNSINILDNKFNNSSNISNDFIKRNEKEIIENNYINIIRKDIENLLLNSKQNQIKYDLFIEINERYNEQINIKKNIEIWEIIYYYIEVCIDIINSEEKAYISNKYIENIINNFAKNLPNECWEMLHYKLISLFLNINEICSDNIFLHQIMGYLLFLLINNKLFYIKDLNNFLNKENEVIINISKLVKYTIIFSDKDAKKFHNDFKQTKLFIGNENFYNYVTLPLKNNFKLCLN